MNEEENTFRILKDLPPAVTSRWCKFGIHTWTVWSAPEPRGYASYLMRRYCIHCRAPNYSVRKIQDLGKH